MPNKAVQTFSFFSSYYECTEGMPDAKRGAFYAAILDYVFKGAQPSLKGESARLFAAIKPNLDTSITRSLNGSKSQAKSNQNANKTKAKAKQKSS